MFASFLLWEGVIEEVDQVKLFSLLLIILLAGVHLSVRYYKKLMEEPRKPLLSFAGGVSVGYITLHILPEFQDAQTEFNHVLHIPEHFADYSLYLIATVGFLTFYSINHLVKRSEQKNSLPTFPIFITHMTAFVIYNSFIGYYLIQGLELELKSLLIFTAVFLLHLMVNDVGLRQDHEKRYDPWGTLILSFSLFAGWLIGYVTTLPTFIFGIWFSWLAGGIFLNTIKEELPDERKSRLIPFLLGAIVSSALLIFI